MVGDYAEGHVGLLVGAVFMAGKLLDAVDAGGEHVGVVIGSLALKHHAQAFEAHACVDVLVGQRLQVAVGLAHELHEHQVPDLDHQRVVGIHQLFAGDLGPFGVGAEVDVDLAAGAAGAGVAHFPEVVVLVPEHYMVGGNVLQPGLAGFLVERGAVFGGAFEHRDVEFFPVYLVYLGEQLPCP